MSAFIRGGRTIIKLVRSAPLVFAALVVASAATTGLVAVLDAVQWRELPFRDPGRLVDVMQPAPSGRGITALSPKAYFDIRRDATVFEGVAAIRLTRSLNLERDGDIEVVSARLASTNLFEVLGLTAAAGRLFSAEHEGTESRLVAVISYDAWTRRFNRSDSAIGSTLNFSEGSRTIIGVLPRGVSLPLITGPDAEVYLPYVPDRREAENTNARSVFVFARMKAGASIVDAQREVERVIPGVVSSLEDRARGDWSRWFTLVSFAVGISYIASSLSVAVLMMMRRIRLATEQAIRRALGATPRRLAAQWGLETLGFMAAGGLAGLALAAWGVEFLKSYLLHELPRAKEVAIDLRVVVITICIFLCSGALVSLAPLLLGRHLPDRPDNVHGGGLTRLSLVLCVVAWRCRRLWWLRSWWVPPC